MAIQVDRNLALPPNEFFPTQEQKSGICLHHTVGGTAASSVNHWKTDGVHVGTAYMIGRDGTIFEIFDPRNWAFQFGLKGWGNARIPFEKRFIGIEIASEGGLIERGGKLFCFDRESSRTRFSRDNAFDYGQDYRGYRYFARYKRAQVDAVIRLINHLCDTFSIPRKVPQDQLKFYDRELSDFKGVIGHVNVRKDKSDPIPDERFWQRVINGCNLTTDGGQPAVAAAAPAAAAPAADLDVDALFDHNAHELVKMNSMAASMVQQVILEIKDHGFDTFIRLRDAGGHTVFYDVVKGDPTLVTRYAAALGAFKEATATKLVVIGG